MAEVKHPNRPGNDGDLAIAKARDFWSRFGKTIMIVCGVVILAGGGWVAYKYLVKEPKEKKANEAIWKAEDYFSLDSTAKALKGDGQFAGFEKIASQYSGTKAGNLANFYVGAIALRNNENDKAIKYLSAFSTDAKQVQARAYKLLGDAYANANKNKEALSAYTKAAREFEDDKGSASEYLFFAAYFADRVMNDQKQAVDLYTELVKKYSQTQYAAEANKYLAQRGVYKAD